MPVADNDGVEIAYEVTGETDADETVVFIGGLGYGRWFWQWQRPAVEDAYRVVLLDNRGVGDSDVPEGPYTMAEMASDVEAVLEDADVSEAHLVGISMGGMIVQEYALRYDRVRSLVLMSTDPGSDRKFQPSQEVRQRILNPPDDLDLRENIRYKMKPGFTEEFWEEHQDVIEEILDYRVESAVSDEIRFWQSAAVDQFDAYDRLSELAVPVLVMHGEQDRVVQIDNCDLLVEAIGDPEVVTVEEGGSHLFAIERAEDVNRHLRDFLDRH